VEWLSYLNPFARHSPSLVDNVRNGVDVIVNEYGKLASVGGSLDRAAAAHKNFLAATSSAFGGQDPDRAERR
jgi:hypothetical protein